MWKKDKSYQNQLFSVLALVLLFMSSCDEKNKTIKTPDPASTAINIDEVTVALPNAKGASLVQANCLTCHSLRYIEMQPDLSRKAWDKVVKKMVKNFGAPINDTTIVNEIVDYLFAIKGKKE